MRVVQPFVRLDRDEVRRLKVEHPVLAWRREVVTAAPILEAVVAVTGIPLESIISKHSRGSRKVSFARHLAMWALREHGRLGPAAIGELLGGRDHSTVITGIGRIQRELWMPGIRDQADAVVLQARERQRRWAS